MTPIGPGEQLDEQVDNGAGMVAVIADDDPDIQQLVGVAVRRAGIRIGANVADGAAAFEAIRNLEPDLAILDVSMPKMTGLQVCRSVRSDPRLAGVRVMLLSAAVQDSAIEAGLEAGADVYLQKPFSPRALSNQIRQLLDSRVAT